MGDIQRKMGTFSTTTSDVMFGITKALVVVVAKQSKANNAFCTVFFFLLLLYTYPSFFETLLEYMHLRCVLFYSGGKSKVDST
mmetsp:Transcript_2683/g.3812  ORF Transcript_2683/g.3812 Transcript_2683/m.3812 type:complete len:83 (-) Transcript_2683:160-408(-)